MTNPTTLNYQLRPSTGNRILIGSGGGPPSRKEQIHHMVQQVISIKKSAVFGLASLGTELARESLIQIADEHPLKDIRSIVLLGLEVWEEKRKTLVSESPMGVLMPPQRDPVSPGYGLKEGVENTTLLPPNFI